MAKQCIYCGRPLAKDDARFCNDCGRPQFTSTNVGAGASAPSAIKVRLPPKEYLRDDLASVQPETNVPGPTVNTTPVSSSAPEQASSPSVRLPKRPSRLSSTVSPGAGEQAPPAVETNVPVTRQAQLEPLAPPTPAEEISTMVLPNWREELAKLRKEQEQTAADATVMREKKPERATKEPPPLPRRPQSALPAPDKVDSDPAQLSGRPAPRPTAMKSPLRVPETPQPQDNVNVLSQAPGTPLPPRESRRPANAEPATADAFLAPAEETRATDTSRRELHVKVWEQETIARPAAPPEQRSEEGPAPAVEENPFATVDFDAEGQIDEDEQLASVTWQAPFDTSRGTQSQKTVKERELDSSASQIQETPLSEEEQQPPLHGERRLSEDEDPDPLVVEEEKQDIEDLPTVPMAVPEQAKLDSSIKIERTSTPAPKKWSAPRTEDVEDLPTRPMPASPGGSGTPKPAQSGSTPPAQGGAQRPEAGPLQSSAAAPQRNMPPLPPPGAFEAAPTAQVGGRGIDKEADPFASRGHPAGSLPGQQGIRFDPASLPPLPPGPPPAPGNRPRTEVQGSAEMPPAPGNKPLARPESPSLAGTAQRSPASEPGTVAPVSVHANTQNPVQGNSDEAKKPRKRKRTGRLMVLIVLLLVLLGVGTGAYIERAWLIQFFKTPVQNQPYQTYQNSALGVSLEYTQQWSVNVDQAHNAVHFADSSRTGQVNLTVTTASGEVSTYLTQQATQLGLTGAKAAPSATIGGASWQALQGTVTQSGATYTAVLYVTQHNGHFYLLEFLAPQTSFKAIDNSDFAHMRTSFVFL